MLLKYGSQAQKRIKASGIGKPQRTPGGMVKLTSGLVAVVPKNHRRVIKVASKRPAALHRTPTAVKRERILVDPCDNSNDSGLGFDHHLDYHNTLASHSALRFSDKEAAWQAEESPEVKRRRLEIKLESDDANDNFTFPETVRQPAPRTICAPARVRSRVVNLPVTLTSQLSATSQSGLTQLQIACQPEQQHRARYQTEGSRGAVKDRTGNGFPVVKLVGYDRPATLQVFIGTDQGRVAPHMFYQACRVSGKNSTPCVEKKVDGTIVIEVEIEPSKDMVVTCDCVGILKERNVDVEHRFPEEGSGRSKKKSTRCRMVFRTVIINQDGVQETLQVTSQPIVCTQPPGVPEICKKSLTSCSVRGGQELFILGKNFLKDTRVLFQEGDGCTTWTQSVQPDKEFLQQSHLVCVVPPYLKADISEPVSVRLVVESSGKASEPHNFLYLPDTSVLVPDGNMVNSSVITQGGNTARVFPASLPMPTIIPSEPAAAPFITAETSPRIEEKINPVMMWDKPAEVMMPPPSPAILPITVRRSSVQMIVPDTLTSEALKQEVPETVLDPPKPMASVADLSSTQSPSMDTFHRFVSNNKSLPAINVSTYLSNIEGNSVYTDKVIKAPMMNELPRIIIPSNKPMLAGDSSNLLTTVESILVNPTAVLPFEGRHLSGSPCASHSTQEGLSVIVTSPTIQNNTLESNMSQEGQRHPQITEIQHSGLDILMAKHILMNKQERSATEGLDAFVNSAAESHISPNPTSPTTASVISDRSVINHIPEIVVNGTNDRSKVQDADILPMVQAASLQVSPRTSPPHGTTNDTLCSLLTSTTQVQPIQTNLEQMKNQIVSSSHSNINSLIQSQVSTNQVFSNVHASLEQQLSSQSVSSTRLSHDDGLHNLMQSPPSSHQVQPLSTIQASFQQQLTSQLDSSQLNHTDLNNILDSSPSQTNQGQGVPNLHASLEQQLSTQPMSSSQVNQCNLSNLMQSSPQNSQNDGRALSSLQRTFEQTLSPQSETSSQTPSESLQSSNVCSRSQIQVLNNFQTSLEHHLTSQVINSNQANIECLTSASIRLTGMESSLPTSSQIQAAVNQAQVISNLHTSLEHHLSSQPVTESVTPNVHSPISQNSSLEASQPPVSQTQALSDLQMSLGHLTSQVMTSASPSHDSRTGNLSQTAAAQVIANQAQTLSSLQASLEQQILTSSEPMMPSERLSNSINISAQQTSTLTNIQASIDHLSSQVLSSSQSNHSESLPSNLTISDPQSCPMSLVGSQPLTYVSNNSSASSTMILSPISHRSPTSVLISPQISLSSSPTLALSPTNLSLQNSRPIEINSPNLVLNTPHNLLSSNVSLSNPQSATMNSVDLQLQSSQSTILRPNAISPFEQVTTSISHGIPVQVTAMNQFGQHQEMQSVSKDCERKEPLQFLIPPEQVAVPPQVPVPTVKKCEEGMPVPHELTQMSEHDLIRYINPSCFDTV